MVTIIVIGLGVAVAKSAMTEFVAWSERTRVQEQRQRILALVGEGARIASLHVATKSDEPLVNLADAADKAIDALDSNDLEQLKKAATDHVRQTLAFLRGVAIYDEVTRQKEATKKGA